MEKGIVKFFNGKRGFGFIASEGEGKEIFVHISNIQGGETLKENDKVLYEIGESEKGPCAINVKIDDTNTQP